MQGGKAMGELFAFLAAVGYTSQLIFIKKGIRSKDSKGSIPIQLFVLLSALVISVTLYAGEILLSKDKSMADLFLSASGDALLFIVLSGLLGSLSGLFLLTKATQLIGSSKTSILRSTNPFFATLLAMIFLGENPGLRGFSGVILLITGIGVISYRKEIKPKGATAIEDESIMSDVDTTPPPNKGRFSSNEFIGSSLAILAGLSFALSQIAKGRALQLNAAPETVVVIGFCTSLLVLSIIHRVTQGHLNFGKGLEGSSIRYYLLAGVGLVLGSYMLALAFMHTEVWRAVAIRNIQPIIALIMAWIFLRQQEPINKQLIIGAAIMVVAVWMTI